MSIPITFSNALRCDAAATLTTHKGEQGRRVGVATGANDRRGKLQTVC